MNKHLKKWTILTIILASLSILFMGATFEKKVKNVIFLIPDGMSVGGTTLTRWYQGGKALSFDEWACGLVRTYSSDAPIADSAPAATAFATGYKSHTGYIGVLPDVADMPGLTPIAKGDEKRPVATILEAAKLAGKSVGLVSTSQLQHATPAAFSSHWPSRRDMQIIGEQQVYNHIDVALGGGLNYLLDNKRGDKENLIAELKNNGYGVVFTRNNMLDSQEPKLFGLFSAEGMSYDMDRDPTVQPALVEMTNKAIEMLSKNKTGFFLVVEGSEIDWAAHANDPVGVVGDILAFDRAVQAALDFAKKDKNTVVIIASDHGNSGLTIGNRDTNSGYDAKPLSAFVQNLKKAKLTAEGVEKLINPDMPATEIRGIIAEQYGIADLTADEEVQILTYFQQVKNKDKNKPEGLNYVLGPMMAKRNFLGFTTNGHTGEEVVLYVYSPNNERLTGVVENTDIALYMEKILGLNLKAATDKLFVNAKKPLESKGATIVEGENGVK
ncbi:MAG: alkaline phosphatase, partial [Desulfobacteraceae bacterium]